jgi:hypothetical protein
MVLIINRERIRYTGMLLRKSRLLCPASGRIFLIQVVAESASDLAELVKCVDVQIEYEFV